MRNISSLIPLAALLFSLVAPDAHAIPETADSVIKVDGSSTVFPISEAVSEEFQRENPKARVTVGVSGTGGGFKKFVAGEIDIVDASRPIKAAELEQAAKNGIAFIELPIAFDALSVVVNPKNTWVIDLTVKELAKIWAPESQGKVMKWSDVRPSFPDKPLQLFGAGTDSGTFDYFTEAIVGKEKASRGDYTSSEDDNVIVTGVMGNEGALGYFGIAYYENNKTRLKVVPIDDENGANGTGPQLPSEQTVVAGTYRPLSRPLFIYVRKDSLQRPEVQRYVSFYLKNVSSLAKDVGYIAMAPQTMALVQARFEGGRMGSMYGGKIAATTSLEQVLRDNQG